MWAGNRLKGFIFSDCADYFYLPLFILNEQRVDTVQLGNYTLQRRNLIINSIPRIGCAVFLPT